MSMDIGGAKGGLKADINVTPLVDVMLVLLIIMMVIAPLLNQGVPLTLPKAHNSSDKPDTSDQTIVTVDSQPTPTWNAVLQACMERILDTGEVVMSVRGGGELGRELRLALSAVSLDDLSRGNLPQKLGVKPYRPRLPAVIGDVMAGGAAARAGLRPGDGLTSRRGRPSHRAAAAPRTAGRRTPRPRRTAAHSRRDPTTPVPV